MSIVRCPICNGLVDLDFNSEDMIPYYEMGLAHIDCLIEKGLITLDEVEEGFDYDKYDE